MNENLFQTEYDVSKKNKLKNFYTRNKSIIFITIFIFIAACLSAFFYSESQKNKRLALANNYVVAKINLENGKKDVATNMLKKLILSNDQTYSTLSFLLVLNENLVSEKQELLELFDHIINNNKFDNEITNLIIFKKLIFQSNFSNESELLEIAKPLINAETVWKPHVLLLMGDYFASKKENMKAKNFYLEILSLQDIQKDFYEHARSKLSEITND